MQNRHLYFYFFLFIICLTRCTSIPHKIYKPKKINLVASVDSINNVINSKNYIYYYQINSNELKRCFFWLFPENFIFLAYDGLIGDYESFENSKDAVNKEVVRMSKTRWYYDYKNEARWGFYRINDDTLFIQYFRYIGPIMPSSVRVSEIQGQILNDSTIILNKEVFKRPNETAFDFITEKTIFDPSIMFKRFEVDCKPDYKKSWLYKSLWYQRYLKRTAKQKSKLL